MRIAIASSGLGHVRRGIESWAEDTGQALNRAGFDVTLFQGAGNSTEAWRRVLPCLRRFETPNARLLAFTRRLGGWRYGFGSGYEIEQSTFSLGLWRAVHSGYDILHVQDPTIALIMDSLNRAGLSDPRVILAHGTEEDVKVLRKYSYLQHLAPGYLREYEPVRPVRQKCFAVPNFIDTEKFHPGNQAAARDAFGLPQDALIILSVAALKKHHKRCDYVIREFEEFRKKFNAPTLLVLAGAKEAETPEVMELGKSLLGDKVLFFEALDRQKLVSLYQAADIFALGSLHEMMPIAVLEAIASGLPISCNNTETLHWMAGPAGLLEDISQPGGLVRQLHRLADAVLRRDFSGHARAYAEATFSEPIVIRQIADMYKTVMEDNPAGRSNEMTG
jgi:1,2-diacylglycerol 3-alpha-glucosyltransferase